MSIYRIDFFVDSDTASLYCYAADYESAFVEGEKVAQIRFPRSDVKAYAARFISNLERGAQ